MSVQDNRGFQSIPNLFIEAGFVKGVTIDSLKMTQERKDAWIERLESAGSEKAVGVLHTDKDADDNASCALGHLEIADGHDLVVSTDLYEKIVELNDVEQLSLPEIAVWVKENVEVTE